MGLMYSTEKKEYKQEKGDEKMVSKVFTDSIKKSPVKKKTSPVKKKTSPRKSPVKKKTTPRKKVSSTPGLTLVPDAETKAGVGYWDEKNVKLRKLKQERKTKKNMKGKTNNMSMTKKSKK